MTALKLDLETLENSLSVAEMHLSDFWAPTFADAKRAIRILRALAEPSEAVVAEVDHQRAFGTSSNEVISAALRAASEEVDRG